MFCQKVMYFFDYHQPSNAAMQLCAEYCARIVYISQSLGYNHRHDNNICLYGYNPPNIRQSSEFSIRLAVLDFFKLLVLPLPESAIVLFIINSAGSNNKFGFVNFHHTSHQGSPCLAYLRHSCCYGRPDQILDRMVSIYTGI